MTRWFIAACVALLLPASADAFCCMKWDSSCAVANSACVTPVAATPPCPNATFNVECANSSCNPTGPTETPTNTATATGTATETATTASGSAAGDWTDDVVALWYLEESGTTIRDNAQGTAALDMAAGNSPSNSATAVQGTYSNVFASGSSQYLSAGDQGDNPGTMTVGCWARPTGTNDPAAVISKHASDLGFAVRRISAASNPYWSFLTDTSDDTSSAANTAPINTWAYVVGTVNGTTMKLFLNGDQVSSQSDHAVSTNATALSIGSRATTANYWDGQIDECVLDDLNWAASSVCKAARCGVDGKLCECDGTTPANYKACSTDADCRGRADTGQLCDTGAGTCRGRSTSPVTLSCTPAACNAASPSSS